MSHRIYGNGRVPSGTPVVPILWRTPPDGSLTVRFTSPIYGLLTHRMKSADQPCPGKEECPAATHRGNTRWKGYGAALIWRGKEFRDWIPGVVEVSSILESQFPITGPIGQCWELYRAPGESGHVEIAGRYLDSRQLDVVPALQWVLPVLVKVYRVFELHLGVENPFRAVSKMETVNDPPPPNYKATPVETVKENGTPRPRLGEIFAQRRKEGAE